MYMVEYSLAGKGGTSPRFRLLPVHVHAKAGFPYTCTHVYTRIENLYELKMVTISGKRALSITRFFSLIPKCRAHEERSVSVYTPPPPFLIPGSAPDTSGAQLCYTLSTYIQLLWRLYHHHHNFMGSSISCQTA